MRHVEAQWPHGQCARLRIKQSTFKPWPGDIICVMFLCKTLNLTFPLSTQVYKWVAVNLMLGITLRWTSIPSREEWKYS